MPFTSGAVFSISAGVRPSEGCFSPSAMKVPYLFSFLLINSVMQGAIVLSGPSSDWISMGGNYDAVNDLQTGQPSSDIVGNSANPGFMTLFDQGDHRSLTDGTLAFRVRLDAAGSKGVFGNNLWVGLDADLNGSVDVFLGVITQGSQSILGIFAPGSGANISPSTTTILSAPYRSYTIGPENYNYRAVNYLTDGGTTNDLSPGTAGDTDYYLSFMIPFQDVVDFLSMNAWQGQSKSQIIINENTPIQYVLATSTNTNSLNQDLGGVVGGVGSKTTWTGLGGFSPVSTIAGPLEPHKSGLVVPEISTSLLGSLGALVLLGRRRRR